MTGDLIKIELTDAEAETFKRFRQFQDAFEILLANKVFDIRNGKAILNFNSEGRLCNIETQIHVYKIGK